MPLEDVLQNYGGVNDLPENVKEVYQNNKKFGALNQKYESPALRARCNGSMASAEFDDVKVNMEHSLANGHADDGQDEPDEGQVQSTTADSSGRTAEKREDEKTPKAAQDSAVVSSTSTSSSAEVSSSSNSSAAAQPAISTSDCSSSQESEAQPAASGSADKENSKVRR